MSLRSRSDDGALTIAIFIGAYGVCASPDPLVVNDDCCVHTYRRDLLDAPIQHDCLPLDDPRGPSLRQLECGKRDTEEIFSFGIKLTTSAGSVDMYDLNH